MVEKERNYLRKFENPFFKTSGAIISLIYRNEM